MFEMWNPSPLGTRVGDCSVRAVSKALNVDWETAYAMLSLKGYELCDMPNSNAVINAVLKEHGFEKGIIPDTCPDCYTIGTFADETPSGTFVLGTGDHVVAVVDGMVYDSWDSSNEIPLFYWKKKEGN